MRALCLLILSAIVNCSVGYTIVERPAKVDEKEFSYNRIPSGVAQLRPSTGFWFQQHPYNLPKSDSQALFELYYLTQVITIYRHHHPRAHRSHLDALVEELQDDGFQQKMRQALQGIKELDVLKAYTDLNLQDYAPFVNDRRQLIPAIHRTLNEIQLGQIKDKALRWTLERLKEESVALTVKMARKEAEVLRELIESNRKVEKAWTVSDILAAVFGKQDEDTMKDFEQKYEVVDDGKPIDDGKVEEFWVVFEDDKREESTTKAPTSAEPETKPFQFVDDNYEQYEAKQEVEVDAKEISAEQISESKEVEETVTIEEVEQSLEQDSQPKEEVEAVAEEEVESLEPDTAVEREDTVAEEETIEESLEQESTVELDGEQRIETDGFEFKPENYESDQDYERTVQEEDDQGLVEEVVAEEELPDSVPEKLQTLDASAEVAEEPEPEYTEQIVDELSSLEDSAKIEEQPEPAFAEELEEELQNPDGPVITEEQLESEFTEEINEDLQSVDGSLEVAEISEPANTEEVEEKLQSLDDSVESEQPELTEELVEEIPEPAAAKASPDSITFPEDPKWVEDSVRPLASSGATGLDSQYNVDGVEAPVTQSVPLWISKGYATEYEGREVVEEEEPEKVQQAEVDTNDLESRAEPTQTVEIDQETLRYVAFEILKVVSLLEDNAGFTGLRDQITTEDVDRLIEQLSVEQFVGLIDEQGINRVEMINALERLIVEKDLENSGEILEVLERWKQGEDAQPVEDGYFGESYGKDGEGEVEGRILDDGEVATSEDLEPLVDDSVNVEEVEPELKSNDLDEAEPVDDGYFGENYGKAEEDEDDIEGRMLNIDELVTSEEAQEQMVDEPENEAELQVTDIQDAEEEVEPESESVQELKSNDLVEESEAEPVDDGYFAEKYGESEDEAEGRTLEDDQETDEAELVVATPDEAQDAEQLVDELEGELKGDAELQVEDSDTLDEISVEPESVQDLKSGDLVEDAELLNDSPELLEDASDLSESISQVEKLQPFPEEVTEDTEPLEDTQRVVVEKKLQPFPEEVTEETVPVNSKTLEPFPDQILDEAQPLEVALDQLEPFSDQILNETQPLEIAAEDQESDSAVDDVKIVPVSNRPFPATPTGGSEPLEVARAGTDEGALADEDRREEILEDLHPEP
uniref:(northern house mosquito) hypothetical protein n=1 Tax=Culex pipiens TaxID=7175 RepID=A0A8D8CFE9_CULPI